MLPQLLIVLLVLLAIWSYRGQIRRIAKLKPATLLRPAGGVASLVVAFVLLLRGRIDVALGLGGFGAYLLGFSHTPSLSGLFQKMSMGGPTGNVSRVRSAALEMELYHDSGAMQGKVLAGSFAGRSLDEMTRPQCDDLLAELRRDDPDGSLLLQAYFDRRFPGWRPAGQRDDDAAAGGNGAGQRFSGAMAEDEAYQILGLAKGASREEVTRAHRTLMKKFHPDHGGSTDIAARINEAKSVLMRRHG